MDRPRGKSHVATLAALTLLVSACGTTPGASPTAGTGTPAPTAAATDSPTAMYCGSGGFDEAKVYEIAQQEGRMVWMATQDLDRAQPFIDAFQETYPGIDVDYQLTSGDIAERFIAENVAGRLSIDVYNPTIDTARYREAGMITDSTEVLVAAGVPADTISPDGIAQDEYLVTGIAYNNTLVAPEDVPTTWEDILDPKWRGLLSVDNRVRPWIYATPFWGEDRVTEFLTRLKDQEPLYRQGESASVAPLLSGESHLVIGSFLGSVLEHEDSVTVGGQVIEGSGDTPWTWDDQLDEVFSTESTGGGPTYSPTAPHPCAAKLWMYWYFGDEATAIRNQIRFRGDPRPGTGTGPSLYLEEHGQEVFVAPPEYDADFREWQEKYLAVLGVTL